MSAKAMSDAIRMKRKKVKDDGLDNMLDTGPAPQMNPQDILNLKQKAQMESTMDIPEKSMAPDDPADGNIEGTSQSTADLKKKMAKVAKILGRLSVG